MENGTHSTAMSEVTGPELDIPIPILHDLIASSVATHGDKTALMCKHQPRDLLPAVSSRTTDAAPASSANELRWTHSQLQYGAELLAHSLAQKGVQPKFTIAVILSGRAEFHLILRAAVKLNCPFTPMNLRSPQNAKEIRHMLSLSETKVVFVEDAFVANALEENVPDLMHDMQLKVMMGGDSTTGSFLSFNDLISDPARDPTFEAQRRALDELPRTLDDTVFIWFTSGTTSLPKAAPHTNRSLTANIRSWGQSFELDDRRAWLHVFVGSSWTLAYCIPGGSVVHSNYNFDVLSIAESISTGEHTDVLLVPSMIDLLAASPLLTLDSNKGIAHVIVGGSKILRSHVQKAFKYLGCKGFSPFFGMTEGTSVCHETLHDVPDVKTPIYSGYTNPGAKVRICLPDGTSPVPKGEPGEIVQGGLQKIERYLGGQGKDSFFTDAGETWFRTGDQAVMTEDGRIDIIGRYKDMIIRGGMNIASAAVEAVIAEGTGLDAQLVGVPDDIAGEVPVAVVKTAKAGATSANDVKKCVLDRLGRSYALERVLYLQDLGVEDWPKTTSGKVLKRDLQVMVLDLIKREREQVKHSNGDGSIRQKRQLQLREDELQKYLLEQVQASGIPVTTIDDDFHSAGMDSLLAMQLRNAIIKSVSPDMELSQNIIFEAGNVRELCVQLESMDSKADSASDIAEKMSTMVERYSMFRRGKGHVIRSPGKHTVLLTGATGSLGAHLLAQLVARSDVRAVYCPVRGDDPARRLEDALRQRSLLTPALKSKATPVSFDVDKAAFGLDGTTLETLRNDLTLIIHAAWPVNFQLSLASFEPHLRGLQSLIQLSMDVKSQHPARMLFCSSMGVALSTQGQRRITEEPIMDLRQASASGYTQSKLVSEYIVQRAAEDFGAAACNLRIGQIIGDLKLGLWNENEAPPSMVRSALTLKKLPALDMECSWMPVDTMAASIIELAMLPREREQRLVYNLCNPRTFSWSRDFLPALTDAGLKFTTTSFDEWLEELKGYSASHSIQVAAAECPAVKLIEFYEATYGKKQRGSALGFDTRAAQADSPTMRDAPDVVKVGLVATMLGAWLEKWTPTSALGKQGGKRKRPASSFPDGGPSSRLRSR
ncbi:hypothetical protein LTR37_016202 [Vermiconidia calcicola]|uniref:Uncharacterized protein n=1 Tax=Vermiconidia calcicola TaxID=1690605 RepID=A0ACC3MNG5_9PEZI|nr:hypothetical protein LTR37_016202 [Vermiconidia calcicola]